MAQFGMIGKLVAGEGRRDELVGLLTEAVRHLRGVDGCELYAVTRAVEDHDAVYVMELWRDEDTHQASLQIPEIRSVIDRARPLIAGVEGMALDPVAVVGPAR